jgi:hypothetical protein
MIKVLLLSEIQRCRKTYYVFHFVEIHSVIGDGVYYFLAGSVYLNEGGNIGV